MSILEKFRGDQRRMRDISDAMFPPGSRVWPIGVQTGNWGGTVVDVDQRERAMFAADYVLVAWDNGNRYAVPIDEIERRDT